MRFSAAIAVCWVLTAPLSLLGADSPEEVAKEREWKAAFKAAQAAKADRDWEGVFAAMERALELAGGLEDRATRVPETLDRLASYHRERWKFAEAVAACEQAVEIRTPQSETALITSDYCNYSLRYLYEKVEAWDEAESFVRERIRQLERSLGTGHSQVASELRVLKDLLSKVRPDDPEIETLLLRVRGMAEDDKAVARASASLGFFHRQRGHHEEAAAALSETLEIVERLEPESDHSSRQITLAREYQALGQVDRAEALFRSAIRAREAHAGVNHITVTGPLYRLGKLLAAEGRLGEAEPFLRRTVEMTDAALGPDDPRYDYQRRELRRVRVALGLEPPGSQASDEQGDCDCPYDWQRVRDLRMRGKVNEALRLLTESLEQAEVGYGPESLEVALVLEKIGGIRSETQPVEALEAHKRRLLIVEQHVPVADPQIASAAEDVAGIYSRLGDLERATEYGLKRLESLRAAGGRALSLADALEDLAGYRKSSGDELESLEYSRLAAGVWASHYGVGSSEHTEVQIRISWSYMRLERHEEAERHLVGVLESLENKRVRDREQIKSVWDQLARVYAKQGRETEEREAKRRSASYSG